MTVRAAESAHERVAVGSVLQRERGEIEPGRPSLRLLHQSFDIFGREAEPEAAVQEGVRLLAGEPQVAGPQLEQLTVGAQRTHRQDRLCPAREHELEPWRRMLDEPGMLCRAVPLESRWKSSRMSVISPWPSSSLTRRGKTTSTTGATTVCPAAELAMAGLARRSASIACVQRTTGSLSPSSSVSHATGFRAASAWRHAASKVVFPKPAGQATRVRLRSDPLRRRSRRRSRGIVSSRTDGGCSFVPTRIGCPAPRRTPSPATEPCRSGVPWRARGTT